MTAATRLGYVGSLKTPFGSLAVAVDATGAVTECSFLQRRSVDDFAAERQVAVNAERCRGVMQQLEAYFGGSLREFDVSIAATGTPFQRRVWNILRTIPFGATTTYGELARRLGDPSATRAVGRANGANPVAIIVPRHRVIGADGSLTGYAGGLAIKRGLLQLAVAQSVLPL